jgi:hypothetical protein
LQLLDVPLEVLFGRLLRIVAMATVAGIGPIGAGCRVAGCALAAVLAAAVMDRELVELGR